MNWPRYMRAMAAESIMQAEEKRNLFLVGTIKTMSEADWTIVAENDALLRDDDGTE